MRWQLGIFGQAVRQQGHPALALALGQPQQDALDPAQQVHAGSIWELIAEQGGLHGQTGGAGTLTPLPVLPAGQETMPNAVTGSGSDLLAGGMAGRVRLLMPKHIALQLSLFLSYLRNRLGSSDRRRLSWQASRLSVGR